jgi:hypothetical protein
MDLIIAVALLIFTAGFMLGVYVERHHPGGRRSD